MKSIKCPGCGLVTLASASTCKRCGGSLEVTKSSPAQSRPMDEALAQSIKNKQALIYGVGFLGAVTLAIVVAVNTESTMRLIVLFGGIVLVGFLSTWVLASLVESKMRRGRDDFVDTVTPGQKVSVLTSSLLCAGIVLKSDYGYVIAPLTVVIFNGALFLYDRQMKAKRGKD